MSSLGQKYQIYENGKLLIFRRTSETQITNVVTGNIRSATDQELKDKYVRLTPDASMYIFVTDSKSRKYDNPPPDVYVVVNKASTISRFNKTLNETPIDLIIRQNCVNIDTTVFDPRNIKINVGVCICNIDKNGSQDQINDLMTIRSIDFKTKVDIYLEDTIDDIISCLPKDQINPVNYQLKKIHSMMYCNMYNGYCKSLKELLEHNNFISNYRSLYNVINIDFKIDLGKESYSVNGDLILTESQHLAFEDILRKHITNISIIKYDRDIDIAKIVSRDHIMVSDTDNIIYLIVYDVVGEYPIDSDIRKAMQVNV